MGEMKDELIEIEPGSFKARIRYGERMHTFADAIAGQGWRTPDTYCNLPFGTPPERSGVYMLICVHYDENRKWMFHRVAYVGMSLNLARRLDGHEVKRQCDQQCYTQIWFKEEKTEDLRRIERDLIQRHDPPYNLVHKKQIMKLAGVA